MKKILLSILLVFPLLIIAQKEKYGIPEFNRDIKQHLKDSGSFDARHLRTGLWVEYKIDSAEKKDHVQSMDQSHNYYVPYTVVITRAHGRYKEGGREGEWKIYKTYDYTLPIQWDLCEIINYKGGRFSGAWHYYSKTGKVIAECTYKNGYQNGVYKKYYSNGKLEKSVPMKNGLVNGVMKTYNEQGTLIFDATVKDNYYNGPLHYYHNNGKVFTTRIYKYGVFWQIKELKDRNGNPLDPGTYNEGAGTLKLYNEFGACIMTIEYKRGIRNGKTTAYWSNGNIRSEYKVVDDTISGIEKTYNKNGQLEFESRVVKGIYEGSKKFYYPNGKHWGEWSMKNNMIWNTLSLVDTAGKPLDFGNFKNGTGILVNYSDSSVKDVSHEYKEGILDGKVIEYYTNGKIYRETDFVDGKIDGMLNYYNDKGILVQSMEMKNDLMDGSYKSFYDNGKLYYEAFYVRGFIWNMISMSDTTGRPLDFGTFKNGNGYLKMYDEKGFFTEKYEYVEGLLNGKAERYYQSGKLKVEYTYVNDTIHGVFKTYYENGTVREQKTVWNGISQGTYTIYHNNGKVWTTRTYVDGLIWSVEVNSDRNGKSRDAGTIKNGNGTMIRYDENEKEVYVYKVVNGDIINPMGDVEEIPW